MSAMPYRGLFSLLLLLTGLSWVLAIPIPESPKSGHVLKRDGTAALLPSFSPYLPPYGIYPGIKPLRPFLIPDIFLNRFATPAPPISPVASFFKSKKDEFLNKLFEDLTSPTDPSLIEVRSAADPEDDLETPADIPTPASTAATTPKPKIDPSVFISKKFDFLAQLFKAINSTTTPAPDVDGVTPDPTATTVKPTIVPPDFWIPFPLPPKPPKPPKAPKPPKTPKPAKAKSLLLDAVDEAMLKSVLAQIDPTNPLVDPPSSKVARKASFLDEFLHRVTTPPPPEEPATDLPPLLGTGKDIETRSLFPPGYWIPPYIYAAKMGIYLDKIFDTLNAAAEADEADAGGAYQRSAEESGTTLKRSASTDASSLILTELTNLKNSLLLAFNETAKSKPEPAKKPSFGKAVWGPKTTPTPDPVQQKIALMSDFFDHLAAVEQLLLAGKPADSPTDDPASADEAESTTPATLAATTIVPPSYWVPDPASPDIAGYYKDKTQKFLSQLFAAKVTTPPPEDRR